MGKASDNKPSFTKTVLQNPPVPDKQTYYWDTKVEGLGIGVTPRTSSRSCCTSASTASRPASSWAASPQCRVEQAGARAIHYHDEINKGNDPRAARKIKEQAELTLKQVYEDYLKTKPNLSANTIRIYEQNQKASFSDWWGKPLGKITEPMTQERHRRDGQKSQAVANQAMRMLPENMELVKGLLGLLPSPFGPATRLCAPLFKNAPSVFVEPAF